MRRRAGNYVGGPTITLVERQVRSGMGYLPGGVRGAGQVSQVPSPTPAPSTGLPPPDPNADIAAAQAAAASNAGGNTILYVGLAAAAGLGYVLYRRHKKKK